jgi:hypothetical protein
MRPRVAIRVLARSSDSAKARPGVASTRLAHQARGVRVWALHRCHDEPFKGARSGSDAGQALWATTQRMCCMHAHVSIPRGRHPHQRRNHPGLGNQFGALTSNSQVPQSACYILGLGSLLRRQHPLQGFAKSQTQKVLLAPISHPTACDVGPGWSNRPRLREFPSPGVQVDLSAVIG